MLREKRQRVALIPELLEHRLEKLVLWVVQQKALVVHVHFGVGRQRDAPIPEVTCHSQPDHATRPGDHTARCVACATSPGA